MGRTYLHLLKTVVPIPTFTQNGCHHTYIYSNGCCYTYIYSKQVDVIMAGQINKRQERFSIHEIGRIDGGRGFRTGGNVLQIGGNTFYDQKNKIPMKISEFTRSGIGIIAEFRRISCRFLNRVLEGRWAEARREEGRRE